MYNPDDIREQIAEISSPKEMSREEALHFYEEVIHLLREDADAILAEIMSGPDDE